MADFSSELSAMSIEELTERFECLASIEDEEEDNDNSIEIRRQEMEAITGELRRRQGDNTIGRFISLLLDTEIEEAKAWIESFIRGYPSLTWKKYCELCLTSEAVECLAYGISMKISIQLRKMEAEANGEYDGLIEKGHAFLKEMQRKAEESGIDISVEKVDFINI